MRTNGTYRFQGRVLMALSLSVFGLEVFSLRLGKDDREAGTEEPSVSLPFGFAMPPSEDDEE